MNPAFEILDKRFRQYLHPTAQIEQLCTGLRWAEGPVWFGDARQLLWSDIPNDRMMRWVEGGGTSTFRQPAHHANGNTRDRLGRLVTCEHGARRVTRTEANGEITVLADTYDGKRLNSPNDVCVKSDGTVWFTDPPYGILSGYEGHQAESELDHNFVFRLDPNCGRLDVVADDFDKPNGIAFSPDERVLYVSDTGASHDPDRPHHIRSFRVDENGKLSGGEVFAEINPGLADGVRLDRDGNLWTSAGDGIHCYDPSGELLGKIRLPEIVSNLAFGGPNRNRLFVTATTSVYAVYVAQRGAQVP